ncbi:ThuA domain-containing protein [Stenotrophomonas sp.]|uniref:ThuA domain-containing protein n=1 Tax=Stenotrophomonas sp. TaxID=69392 RepID=UPI0028AD4173|nr:ThuA domain-containing protein [Stenotrophomonas sp.]
MRNRSWMLIALLFACGNVCAQQFKVLVAAIPNQYHHDYIPVAKPQFEAMARQHYFDLTWAWNASAFDQDLSQYAAIVLLNTPATELSPAQREKFQQYVRNGGGVVAVHKAFAIRRGDWNWYDRMIGRSFRTHPYLQTAMVDVVNPDFPATAGLPQRWVWSDEWYEYDPLYSDDLVTLMTVDERSYDPTLIWPGQVAKGMGKEHPVAWYHRFEGGRVFATALGHQAEAYNDPRYLEHLYGGIYWAATGKGEGKPPAP